jgi:replicative DNA helicase
MNALKTGLHADPVKLFDWLLEEDEDAAVWILNKLHDYATEAPRDVYAAEVVAEDVDDAAEVRTNLTAYGDDILLLCVRDYARWRATKQQLQEGIVKTTQKATDSGAVPVEDSNPVNLDLDRMDKTTIRQKDKLGLLPDSKHEEDDVTVTIAEVMQEELTE